MLESEIEQFFVKEIKYLGGIAYKFTSPGNAGVPDRIVIFPNRQPIFVELKTENGKLTKLQKAQHRRLLSLGQRVEKLSGLSDMIQFFAKEGFLESAKKAERKAKGYGIHTT